MRDSHFADHVLDLVERQFVQRELPKLVHGCEVLEVPCFLSCPVSRERNPVRVTSLNETRLVRLFTSKPGRGHDLVLFPTSPASLYYFTEV